MDPIKVAITGVGARFTNQSGIANNRHMFELSRNLDRISEIELTVLRFPTWFGLPPAASYVLQSAVTDFSRFDIVHNADIPPIVPLSKGGAVIGSFVPDIYPLLSLASGSSLLADGTNPLESLGNTGLAWAIRLALRGDFLIVPSTLTKSQIAENCHYRGKLFVVNQGVDDRFRAPLVPRRSHASFRVGYLGAFGRRKNVAFAIDAIRASSIEGIELGLWGRSSRHLQALLAYSAGDSRITYRGRAPERNLLDIYDSLDAFVFPSILEGFGLPILEAQARGLPVLIWKQSMIPQEVRRYCIEAADPADMARLLEEIRLRGYDPRIRDEAALYARGFSWHRTAQGTAEAFSTMVG